MADDNDTKPDVETINLKVATQDGNEIFFKVSPSFSPPFSLCTKAYVCDPVVTMFSAPPFCAAVQEDNAAEQADDRLLPAPGPGGQLGPFPL